MESMEDMEELEKLRKKREKKREYNYRYMKKQNRSLVKV